VQNKSKSLSISQKVFKKKKLPISSFKTTCMHFRYSFAAIFFFLICLIVAGQNETHKDSIITIPGPDSTTVKTFGMVEKEAEFPGGDAAWRKFLEQNLRGQVPAENGAPAGIYTVLVQFIVDREGRVSDIKQLTNWGYGMEAEVIRLIKKSVQWTPATQDGRAVKAYRRQPVTFQLDDADIEVIPKNSGILYVGIDNPVTISARKAKEKNLTVNISQGTITGDDGSYIIRVVSPGRATIVIYNKNKKLGSYSLEVQALPS
jgi:hypothetical protein